MLVPHTTSHAPRVPAVDLFESETCLRIVVDVPGSSSEDVDLTLEAGELRLDTRGATRFHRSFKVPDVVDTDAIEAEVADGVLTLTLPKSAAARPRKLTIHKAA